MAIEEFNMPINNTNEKHDALDLISEILDKMIDMQQASTAALIGLKSSIEESGRTLTEINKSFKNGFRTELKDHISKEIRNIEAAELITKKDIEQMKISVEQFRELLARPAYWVKLILATVTASATAMAAATALIIKFMN